MENTIPNIYKCDECFGSGNIEIRTDSDPMQQGCIVFKPEIADSPCPKCNGKGTVLSEYPVIIRSEHFVSV